MTVLDRDYILILHKVLERARKAEAEAADLRMQLKAETTNSRRVIREMESQVQQSTTLSHRSEREYITLRDSVKYLKETWTRQLQTLQCAIHEKEVFFEMETKVLDEKYRALLQQIERERELRGTVDKLLGNEKSLCDEWRQSFQEQIDGYRSALQHHFSESELANRRARSGFGASCTHFIISLTSCPVMSRTSYRVCAHSFVRSKETRTINDTNRPPA